MPLGAGHIYSRLQQADFANGDARSLFHGAWTGEKLNYRLAHAAAYRRAVAGGAYP